MSEQSRREFLMTAGLAGLAAGMAGDATAQPVGGKWEVSIRWHDRAPVKVEWTLNGDGTFSSSDGYSGTWTQSRSLLLLSVRSDTHPVFAGITRERSIENGLALQPGGVRGFWSAHLLP